MKRKLGHDGSPTTSYAGSENASSEAGRSDSKLGTTTPLRNSAGDHAGQTHVLTRSASKNSAASSKSNPHSAGSNDSRRSSVGNQPGNKLEHFNITISPASQNGLASKDAAGKANGANNNLETPEHRSTSTSRSVSPKSSRILRRSSLAAVPQLRKISPEQVKSGSGDASNGDPQAVRDRLEQYNLLSPNKLPGESQPSNAHTPVGSTDVTPMPSSPLFPAKDVVDASNAAISVKKHSHKLEKRLPGRRRQPNPDVRVEAELRRQLQLKTSYRIVAKALKPILAELAKRTIDEVEDDPEAHKRCEEYERIKRALDARLADRLELLNRTRQTKEENLKGKLAAETEEIRDRFANKVRELKEDAILRCKHQILSIVRDARKSEEATEDEDGIIPRLTRVQYPFTSKGPLPEEYDSRSRVFVETERHWTDEKTRTSFGRALQTFVKQEYPEEESEILNHSKRFATFDPLRRDFATAVLNLETLKIAAEEVDRQPPEEVHKIVSNAEASALQLLASAADSATPVTPKTTFTEEKTTEASKKQPAPKKHRFAPYTPKIKAAPSTAPPDPVRRGSGPITISPKRRQRHASYIGPPVKKSKVAKSTKAENAKAKAKTKESLTSQQATKIVNILNREQTEPGQARSVPPALAPAPAPPSAIVRAPASVSTLMPAPEILPAQTVTRVAASPVSTTAAPLAPAPTPGPEPGLPTSRVPEPAPATPVAAPERSSTRKAVPLSNLVTQGDVILGPRRKSATFSSTPRAIVAASESSYDGPLSQPGQSIAQIAPKEPQQPSPTDRSEPHRNSFWSTVRRLSQTSGPSPTQRHISDSSSYQSNTRPLHHERDARGGSFSGPDSYHDDRTVYPSSSHSAVPLPPPPSQPPTTVSHERQRSSIDLQRQFPPLAPRPTSSSFGERSDAGQRSPVHSWTHRSRPSIDRFEQRAPSNIPTNPSYSPTSTALSSASAYSYSAHPGYPTMADYRLVPESPKAQQPPPQPPVQHQSQPYGAPVHSSAYESRAYAENTYNPPPAPAYYTQPPPNQYYAPVPHGQPITQPYQQAPPPPPSPGYNSYPSYPMIAHNPLTAGPPLTNASQYAGPQYGGQPILPANLDPTHPQAPGPSASSSYGPTKHTPAFSQLRYVQSGPPPPPPPPPSHHQQIVQPNEGAPKKRQRNRGSFPNTEFRRYHGPRQR